MASLAADPSAPNPALAAQAALLARPVTEERRMADAIRALAIDAVEQAKSGHPGMPMGMADVATVLFTKFRNSTPPTRAGRTATASCSRPAMAPCCSMPC